MLVNVSKAKTNLSSLINRAYQGETITIAKHNLPPTDGGFGIHKPENKKKIKQPFGLYKDLKIDGLAFQKNNQQDIVIPYKLEN